MKIVGIKDRFGESGRPEELLKKFGISRKEIIKAVMKVLKMKKNR